MGPPRQARSSPPGRLTGPAHTAVSPGPFRRPIRLPPPCYNRIDQPVPHGSDPHPTKLHTVSDYDPQAIEKKWQRRWADERAFEVAEEPERPKYYCLVMFAYPSGHAHVGHVRNYMIGDVIARMKRLRGFNVLHPFGWDAFGLPAENAAIKNRSHPETWTLDNIAHMKGQLQRLGISYAWERELATCEAAYYRWNQWLFLRMFERGLAYRRRSTVNWCPDCATVLANEQVVDGGCWRCGYAVEPRDLDQWFLRITEYADGLLEGIERLDEWPAKVLTMQRNWIGRSEGARVRFAVEAAGPDGSGGAAGGDSAAEIEVFTTRIDTIFGATFVLLAPEHPLVARFIDEAPDPDGLRKRVQAFRALDRTDRLTGAVEKEGFDTGRRCVNPFTGRPVPIWVANFVLAEYGTGAVMAVPAHDQRDFEFARKYGLPVEVVIQPEDPDGGAPLDGGDDGRRLRRVRGCWPAPASSRGGPPPTPPRRWRGRPRTGGSAAPRCSFGSRTGASRASATGARRSPSSTAKACGLQPVPDADLPVELPKVAEFSGRGDSPLAQIPEFVETACPSCGRPARRETDTMDTFVDSSWYFYRFCDPTNDERAFDPDDGPVLGPRRLLHRRRRARYPAPDLLALLLPGVQGPGDGRPRRAVHAAPDPGDGAAPRRGDVEVEGQRGRPRRDDRQLRGRRPAALRDVRRAPREGDRVDRRGSRGELPLPDPGVAPRHPGRARAGRCPRRRRGARARRGAPRPAAEGPRHDPARLGRPRSPRPPEHRGVRADGAGERAVRVLRRARREAGAAARGGDRGRPPAGRRPGPCSGRRSRPWC